MKSKPKQTKVEMKEKKIKEEEWKVSKEYKLERRNARYTEMQDGKGELRNGKKK